MLRPPEPKKSSPRAGKQHDAGTFIGVLKRDGWLAGCHTWRRIGWMAPIRWIKGCRLWSGGLKLWRFKGTMKVTGVLCRLKLSNFAGVTTTFRGYQTVNRFVLKTNTTRRKWRIAIKLCYGCWIRKWQNILEITSHLKKKITSYYKALYVVNLASLFCEWSQIWGRNIMPRERDCFRNNLKLEEVQNKIVLKTICLNVDNVLGQFVPNQSLISSKLQYTWS